MAETTTLFLQIVRKLPNSMVQNAIQAFGVDFRTRVLFGRHHLYALLLGHLGGATSLRHVVELWDGIPDIRRALGMTQVARSTLADANQSRPHEFFRALMAQVLEACHRSADRFPRKLRRLSYALDSTTLELCVELHEWAQVSAERSAIKVHMLLRTGLALPELVVIGDGATHDLVTGKHMALPANAIIAMDRAYVDAQFFSSLHDQGTVFITRIKRGMKYRVIDRRKVPRNAVGVTSDQQIVLTGSGAVVYGDRPLRRVRYRDPQTGLILVFLTNDLRLSARTIAQLYRERWQVETFFKWIKQNVKVLRFWGRSKNAILIQLWVALLAYALVSWIQLSFRTSWSRLRTWRFVQGHLLRPVGDWFWQPEVKVTK